MAMLEFKTPNGVIAYTRRGLGDPLVLLHGLYPGASHQEYDHNVSALQQRHTVYALDLLGFGQSDVPRMTHTAEMHQHFVRNFINEVIGVPAAVVASGASCGIATRLGVYDDGLLTRLVLLAPQQKPVYHEPPGLADRLSRFVLGTLAAGASLYEVDASPAGLAHWIRDNYHDPQKWLPAKLKQLHVEANEPNKMMAHISQLCGYFDTDLAHWLPYVRRPTLVVMGADCMPIPQAEWFRPAQWSQGKSMAVVDNAKNFPHEEQSARVNGLMDSFLGNQNGTD
jgi:pimeloyl-ACP methyl ester carboxylesterase